jgi:16S rRNA (guanine527-N7)-methyltransferase
LSPNDLQLDQLLRYLALLQKWNKAYNLTAVRSPEDMVTRHILDSLVVSEHLHGQRIIDVGTGAGLPGIPLAIINPDRDFHLLDSNGKKTRFLFQVKTELGLANITGHHARVELFKPDGLFDLVLSRAFASLKDMVISCQHLLTTEGCYLAMKGAISEQELLQVATVCGVAKVSELTVPSLDEQRHLIKLINHSTNK